MSFFSVRVRRSARLIVFSSLMFSAFAAAQTCLTAADMDEPTRNALVSAAKKYFDMAARGDAASLKQNAIASLASDFGAIETAIKDNQANFSGAQANARPPFLLKAEGTAPLPKAEFLCGVFGAQGQTRDSAEFVIPNLPPGNYGVVILDVPTSKGANTVSFVLQQRSEEHTSELQSHSDLVCRLLLEKKNTIIYLSIILPYPSTTVIYTLSLHDALPIFSRKPSSCAAYLALRAKPAIARNS